VTWSGDCRAGLCPAVAMLGFWWVLALFAKQMVYPENIAQAVGGLAAFLAFVGSMAHIGRHLLLNHTVLRTCTVRILLVVPIFSLDAFASLLLEGSHLVELLSCLREVYEALALASFMQLILAVLGGPTRLDKLLEDGGKPVYQLGPLRHLPGLREPYRAGPEFLAAMISGILQYIGVMIAVFMMKLVILEADGPRSHLMTLPNVVKSVSCGWALNCIVLFSHEVYDQLPNMHVVLKFLSIKGIVFFTFWQGIVINLLQVAGVMSALTKYVRAKAEDSHLRDLWWNEFEITSGMNDFLLCGEMLFFCVLHWVAYPAREFQRCERGHLARHITAERGFWTPVSRLLTALRLRDMAEMYSQVEALRGEARQRRIQRICSKESMERFGSLAQPLSP